MKFMRLLLVLVTLLILSSCASMQESIRTARITDEFTTSSKGYVQIIRWHEFDKTTLIIVDEPLREDFQKRMMAAEQVKVVDYRVKDLDCSPLKGTAEVTVEWDYYIPPSVTIKTVKDPQKWRYVEDKNRHGWILTTLLPVFK
jgi:hypothetical protein